ncbi:MAG: FG-GAP-like repeat-containing protein, partial [Candidatus Promineifilaceae bacterium]
MKRLGTDLDVIFMNRVWLNDGRGNFTEKGQEPGFGSFKFEIALADIDNDDDLDLVTAMPGPNEIWLNDGDGVFTFKENSSCSPPDPVTLVMG